MKKVIITVWLLLSISVTSYGQLAEKMKSEKVTLGSIVKDGKEIVGYIKMMGVVYVNQREFSAPWEFQDEIKFMPKDVFEKTEKIKNKMYESYGPKDCDGYKYDTLVYESVKYADMSAVGANMLPKKVFARKVSNEKVTLFQYFGTPPRTSENPGGFEADFIEYAKPRYLYRMGKDGKVKSVNDMNIQKELADCPMVVEKQAKREYKVVGSEEKTSKANKLLNNSVFKEQVRLMAIKDYNKNCK